ncbi:SHD1 domain-containing protein [Flammeovirga kamogawensis]|uniref:SLA1 homology domain-containing protein n=1 Tax=Flammeovirga kamogawensis TaxID=373891 RepID=A0ABX8H2A5_9BACT|nr:SHD1 domain-containing protein [Flammeovirga kamogawensis]MBB6463739.1 hypothetical protein [Flammeovirga kamogawensis]QWG09749.1 hypothetical protein KM029_24430 [Flammeovirga kamogawensis]TRX65262.1 hypothetical protein EO216_22320 [Flammeovirga kamogawensis]
MKNYLILFVTFFVSSLGYASTENAYYHVWNDQQHNEIADAQLILVKDANVILEQVDGSIFEYPIQQLSSEDVKFLETEYGYLNLIDSRISASTFHSNWVMLVAIIVLLGGFVLSYFSEHKTNYIATTFLLAGFTLFVLACTSPYVDNVDKEVTIFIKSQTDSEIVHEVFDIFPTNQSQNYGNQKDLDGSFAESAKKENTSSDSNSFVVFD